jgi:LacI family transcriptional regulator
MSRRRIAIVIDLNWTLKHHQEVFAGTQQYARDQGWESVLWPYAPAVVDGCGRKLYDGIIARATPQLAAETAQAGIPLVNVWVSSPARDIPAVFPDVHAAGEMAGEHLRARGFQNYAYVGFARTMGSRRLESGFRRVIREEGAGNYSRFLVSSAFRDSKRSWVVFQRGLNQWLKSLRLPVGILAVSDGVARSIANAAWELGVKVPQDIAVVGVENEEVVCLNPEPSLTSIEFGFNAVGIRASELLEELMDGAQEAPGQILLPPVALVPRRSTGVFSVADADVAKALRYISDECSRRIKVSDVVDRVALSRRSLERKFQNCRGGTIHGEITRSRIERAKRLLAETSLLVKQVAESCGFANTRRFCEVFGRLEGISPTQYRDQRRGGR